MSTAPSGWQTPKTNWDPTHGVGASDFNRIEANIQAIELGERTLDPDLATPSNTGTLRQILSWLAGRIRAITGKAHWYEAPAITLEQAKAGIDAAAVHAQDPAPHSGHAKLAGENIFTSRQTFAAGIQDGDSNTDVSFIRALQVATDTRTIEAAAWDENDNPTTIVAKDGEKVLGTLIIGYNADGKPTSGVITVGEGEDKVTVTITQVWNGERFVRRTKVVS